MCLEKPDPGLTVGVTFLKMVKHLIKSFKTIEKDKFAKAHHLKIIILGQITAGTGLSFRKEAFKTFTLSPDKPVLTRSQDLKLTEI